MKLIFASNNKHKIEEIKALIGDQFELLSLEDAGIIKDIPEPHNTLEENASEKSRTIYALTRINCFGEDTGLEVDALNGEPGVKSARYAGGEKSFTNNIEKLLSKLGDAESRMARFRAVISLIIDGTETRFEGICTGTITNQPKGDMGFGYDPVFIPEGENRTFAQMSLQEKSRYSHRAIAVAKLVTFLQTLKTKPGN